ncbi:MAG: diguanylate cyclase [Deltaproteobacteria bacterium]|nr:diguanylate cyclase [Deltaproteobacteria bacterium]
MTSSKGHEEESPLIFKYKERFQGSPSVEPLSFAEAAEIFDAYLRLDQQLREMSKISPDYRPEEKQTDQHPHQTAENISRPLDRRISNDSYPGNTVGMRMLFDETQRLQPHIPDRVVKIPDDADIDDPVVARFIPIIADNHYVTNPLYDDFSSLFQKYVRLSKRLNRIAKISDSYQSQLQELKIKLEHASRTDFLTGLINRRTMYHELEAELSRSQRYGKTFATIMADLDHFKKVNDSQAHQIVS